MGADTGTGEKRWSKRTVRARSTDTSISKHNHGNTHRQSYENSFRHGTREGNAQALDQARAQGADHRYKEWCRQTGKARQGKAQGQAQEPAQAQAQVRAQESKVALVFRSLVNVPRKTAVIWCMWFWRTAGSVCFDRVLLENATVTPPFNRFLAISTQAHMLMIRNLHEIARVRIGWCSSKNFLNRIHSRKPRVDLTVAHVTNQKSLLKFVMLSC